MLDNNPQNKKQISFPLGQTVATPNALEAIAMEALVNPSVSPLSLLARHQSGDWGDLDMEDKRRNDFALNHEERIFSAYKLEATGQKIWIITEWDRSYTTLLLPEDY